MPEVRSLAAGELHTLALTTTGEVWSWGDNQLRQCARELKKPVLDTPGRVALPLRPGESVHSISASGYHAVAVTTAGRVLSLGSQLDATFVDEEHGLAEGEEVLMEGEDADGLTPPPDDMDEEEGEEDLDADGVDF